MKKSLLCGFLTAGICSIWAVRYITLNQGNILSYPYQMHTIEYYDTGDNVEFGENSIYYSDKCDLNGFSLTVNSSEIIDFNGFRNKYMKNADEFENPCESYLEVNISISNLSGSESEFLFLPLLVKGVDWWTQYSAEETGFANNSVQLATDSYGQIKGINIKNNESVNINLVYSLFRDMFISERRKNLEKESKYLVLTSVPAEKRVRL